MTVKVCPRCGQDKSLDEFGSHRGKPFDKAVWCLECTRAYSRVRKSDPIVRARLAAKARKRREDPAVKERERLTNALYNQRNATSRREKRNTDEYRAHYRARITTPEGRERNRIVQANRRARRKHGQDAKFTAGDWQEVLAGFGNRCAYCLNAEPLQVEHLQPLVSGGRHERSNIVPACGRCNRAKSSKGLVQFLAYSTGRCSP